MMDWKKYVISDNTSILEALRVINDGASGFVMVADEHGSLMGTVTDGNIRRGLLHGLGVHESASKAMNTQPTTARPGDKRQTVLRWMRQKSFSHIPVVNEANTLVGLWSLKELLAASTYENPVVIMAGGLGTRLGELTRDCPKPMLHIGGKPLLEIVLQNFIDNGFSNFFIAVNYKAEQVEGHFHNGERWGVSIKYIKEKKRLGTAGALSLLPQGQRLPILVMNGDILTRLQGSVLLDAHNDSGAAATMVMKSHEMHVPYGVVDYTETGLLTGIREKPKVSFPVSAGINVISPEALELIPYDTFFDMPNLFHALLHAKKQVYTFAMDEYWVDIGHMLDYQKANADFQQYFLDTP